jgi:CheY-like chemotaxis protein
MPHVLLVEDEPFTARMLVRLLEKGGACRVAHAATVREALSLLDPPPDWVILDLNLPDGTGLAVLEAIRGAGLPTKVVVSSATTDSGLMAAAAAHEPDVIIPKPIDVKLLPIGLAADHWGENPT